MTRRPTTATTMKATIFGLHTLTIFSFSMVLLISGCDNSTDTEGVDTRTDAEGVIHVHPGDSIQEALDAAAESPSHRIVRVHAGTYRPQAISQAAIRFNSRHDGIVLEAEGEVILTAANPDIADRSAASYPAIVNHVVFFGDGISRKTVLRGFKITGANNFVTESKEHSIEPDSKLPQLKKGLFFYADGGYEPRT
jgi:hypothetical protein